MNTDADGMSYALIFIILTLLMIKSIVEKVLIGKFSRYLNGIEYNKLTIEVLGGFFKI